MDLSRRQLLSGIAAAASVGVAGCVNSENSENESVDGTETFRPFAFDAPNLHIFLVDVDGPPSLGIVGGDISNVVVERGDVAEAIATFAVTFERDNFVANLDPAFNPYDELDGTYYVHSVVDGTDPVESKAESVPVVIENGEMTMQTDRATVTDAGEAPF